jgi:hypothetical protein
MNREDIIRMARKAELIEWGFDSLDWEPVASIACIERFAALVAAAEREACAKVCDERPRYAALGEVFAAAIRARSNA